MSDYRIYDQGIQTVESLSNINAFVKEKFFEYKNSE